jgi:hypothetical protein
MNVSKKGQEFIQNIGDTFPKAASLIWEDIKKFQKDITNLVLKDKINLEGSWNDYVVTDINLTYEENMIKFRDMIQVYGIHDDVATLYADDVGLVASYEYTLVDAMGGIMDRLYLFHITVKSTIDGSYHNNWYILNRQ